MSKSKPKPLSKAERAEERRYTSQRRRERQQLAERYEARPLLPTRELEGVYRP